MTLKNRTHLETINRLIYLEELDICIQDVATIECFVKAKNGKTGISLSLSNLKVLAFSISIVIDGYSSYKRTDND